MIDAQSASLIALAVALGGILSGWKLGVAMERQRVTEFLSRVYFDFGELRKARGARTLDYYLREGLSLAQYKSSQAPRE